MDFTNLATWLPAWTKNVWGPLLAVSAFALVWWRSGSPHLVWERLWKLTHLWQKHDDPEIRRFLTERNMLMEFRVVTGIMAGTLQDAHATIKWGRDHNVNTDLIAKCGTYFDCSKPGLRPSDQLPTWGGQERPWLSG